MTTQKQKKSLSVICIAKGSEYQITTDNETYNLVKMADFQNWDINYYNKDEDRNYYIITFTTLKECKEFLLTHKKSEMRIFP
tara:strand:- start:308 stop:553 length:246 start_codon:yes stop_codon:yes gene_type:complete